MDIIASQRQYALEELLAEAEALAGRTSDFGQRAMVYHHLYDHSLGNHGFPLLAAHGALWGADYFRQGRRLGRWLQWRFRSARRGQAMAALERFAEALREINRQVCVETYLAYRLTASTMLRGEAERRIEPRLLTALDTVHAARRSGRLASRDERRELFAAFFEWEQEAIVGPQLTAAFAEFDWPELNWMARRSVIRFAYLGRRPLRFRDFSSREERLAKGMAAFDRAERKGWDKVATSLAAYRALPPGFLANPARHFYELQRRIAEKRRRCQIEPGFGSEESVTLQIAA